ncbi:hypothetical protein Q8W71_14300 [Methylobacterium sp. NEAU 140]|uniref:hypothetical protein n=1 Tax=Methylobacterium sp. NEAU 140 TaxID=3064945 RepID=UPI0027374D27|nr:hypothetical protein [Methylobacterium sp. NEAU 140]MDP4023802.1 hypothetical protein [Methylobacterium sp. NEAU 140]
MLEPADLLGVARTLASGATPSDAAHRRAISTAYYALFHAALRTAAERFIGRDEGETAAYALLYRGFAHGRMRDVCVAIEKPHLAPRYAKLLRRPRVSQEMRTFASAFVDLQQRRHTADYDPQAELGRADAADACDSAELAMTALARAGDGEIADIFALLLVDPR